MYIYACIATIGFQHRIAVKSAVCFASVRLRGCKSEKASSDGVYTLLSIGSESNGRVDA